MKTYTQLVREGLNSVEEVFPWDLDEMISSGKDCLMLDIREQDEFDAMHIKDSLLVPRGILEGACDWGYDDTIPELVEARDREVIVICRSGNRSVLAALTMQWMGFSKVKSLKTGIRGWNDFELPLFDKDENQVDIDEAEEALASHVTEEQMGPAST
jgi:rhodanese-related sulfurtransferase